MKVLEESAAFEAYGRSFGQRSIVVFEARKARVRKRRRPLDPEVRARCRRTSIKNLCKALAKKLENVFALDCYAEDEKKIAARNQMRPIPARQNGGQYELDFLKAHSAHKRLHYVTGVPYRYALS